jgi:hypothetical protein
MRIFETDTLQDAVEYFASPDNCREYLVAHRWPEGVACPRCGSKNVLFQAKYNRWQCGSKHDLRQFTSKTGTIFEDSPLPLNKWLLAMWQVVNRKNGASSYEIARATGVTQKSAWFMDHRIRVALGMATPDKFTGHVKADETLIGQKRNMHRDVRERKITGTGGKDKTAVMGILERGKDGKHGTIRTTVIPSQKKKALQAELRKHVALEGDQMDEYGIVAQYLKRRIQAPRLEIS